MFYILAAKVLLFLGLLVLCSFFLYLLSLIFYLFETFDNILDISFIGIILDGDSLSFEVGDDVFDTFLKTQVALDLLLATLTVHLWIGGNYDGLNVFSQGDIAEN